MTAISRERSYMLVGKFMEQWAIAELQVDYAIAKALKLNDPQSLLFSSTLRVSQKLDVLKVLIDASQLEPDERARFKKHMGKLSNLSGDRNKIAHALFIPTRNGNEVFFVTTALKDGELKSPQFAWSEEQFHSRYERLKNLADKFEELGERLEETGTDQRFDKFFEKLGALPI